jgi:hypothetical protein
LNNLISKIIRYYDQVRIINSDLYFLEKKVRISRRNLQRLVERYLLNEQGGGQKSMTKGLEDYTFYTGTFNVPNTGDAEGDTTSVEEEYTFFTLSGGYYVFGVDLNDPVTNTVSDHIEQSPKIETFEAIDPPEDADQKLKDLAEKAKNENIPAIITKYHPSFDALLSDLGIDATTDRNAKGLHFSYDSDKGISLLKDNPDGAGVNSIYSRIYGSNAFTLEKYVDYLIAALDAVDENTPEYAAPENTVTEIPDAILSTITTAFGESDELTLKITNDISSQAEIINGHYDVSFNVDDYITLKKTDDNDVVIAIGDGENAKEYTLITIGRPPLTDDQLKNLVEKGTDAYNEEQAGDDDVGADENKYSDDQPVETDLKKLIGMYNHTGTVTDSSGKEYNYATFEIRQKTIQEQSGGNNSIEIVYYDENGEDVLRQDMTEQNKDAIINAMSYEAVQDITNKLQADKKEKTDLSKIQSATVSKFQKGDDIKFKKFKGQNPQVIKRWNGKEYATISQNEVDALDNYQFKVYNSSNDAVGVQRYSGDNPESAFYSIPKYLIDSESPQNSDQKPPTTNAQLVGYYNVKGTTGKADGEGGMTDVKKFDGVNLTDDGKLQYVDDAGNVLKTVPLNTTLSTWLDTIPDKYKYDTYIDFEQAVRDNQGDPNDPIEDTPESAKAAIKAIAEVDPTKAGVVKVPKPEGVGTTEEDLVVNIDPTKTEVVDPYIVPKVADEAGNKEPVKVDGADMINVTVVATKQALLDGTTEDVDDEVVKTAVTTQTTQTSEGDSTATSTQTKPTKKEADSWARYISETVRKNFATQEEAEAVKDGWKSLSVSNPDLSTGEYRNWQRWYNKIRNDRAFMDMYVGKPAGSHISPQDIARVYGMFAISEPETYGGTEIASQVTVDDVQAGLTNISKREKRKEARREKGRKFLQNVKDLNPQLLKDFIDKRKAKKAESTDQATSTGASSTASSSQTRTLQSLKDEAQQWIDSQTTGRTYVTVTAQQPNTARLKAANKLRTGEADVFLDHVVGPDSNGAYAYIAYSKDAEAGTNESNQLNERMMRLAGIGRQTKSQAQQEKHLQEAVSRGELYRRRYYGRY